MSAVGDLAKQTELEKRLKTQGANEGDIADFNYAIEVSGMTLDEAFDFVNDSIYHEPTGSLDPTGDDEPESDTPPEEPSAETEETPAEPAPEPVSAEPVVPSDVPTSKNGKLGIRTFEYPSIK